MSDLKTTRHDGDVIAFIESVDNERRKRDSFVVLELMRDVTGQEPEMWGPAIVGFDSYRYKYESGREGEWFRVGFSPRKQNLTLYIMPGFEQYAGLLDRLGKHKIGKSCLYINKLDDVDLDVLRELIAQSVAHQLGSE